MYLSYQEAGGQNSMTSVLQESNVSFRYPWEQMVAVASLLTSPKVTVWEGKQPQILQGSKWE